MHIAAYYLAKGSGIYRYPGESLLHSINHPLESINLGGQILSSSLRTLNAQAELEILLVSDQDIGYGSNLMKSDQRK